MTTDLGGAAMAMDELSTVLWRERELLESLLYTLEVEELVLASGRGHLLARAAREAEGLTGRLFDVELMRALEVDTLAFELGLPPNADLAAIAGASAEPWHAIWLDHRRILTTIVTAIGTLVETNEHLLTVGPAPVPVPAGRASVVAEVDLRDVAYRAAAAGSARVLPPSLRDFLR